MKTKELIAVVLFLLATVGTVVGVFAIENYRRSRLFSAELIARAPEYGNWYPRELRLPSGKETTILIRNIDTVTHGFAVPDLNISVNEIKAGEVKVITLKADKSGTFPFMCTVWCSDLHMAMRGELVFD